MNKWATRLLVFIIANGCFEGFGATAATGDNAEHRIRALILSNHESDATTQRLKAILEASNRFQTRVCESLKAVTSALFADFDVVILADQLDRDDVAARALSEFVASGKGLVATRRALCGSHVLGIAPLSIPPEPGPAIHLLRVNIIPSDHPIALGLKPEFRTADSLPPGLVARPNAQVIARAESKGAREPVLAIATHGKGRVVAIALGIDASAMHEPSYGSLVSRSAEWAATAGVPQPAAENSSGVRHQPIRALLITGGHDHDAAFYSLFVDIHELDGLPVDTASNAFKKDLREKYDVIIMYDFTRDMDDTCKRNLRLFVESGKGIVVLHHALLNYQSWKWWHQDVVGGRYRLQREGPNPSSSVKNDEQIFVTPINRHAVLSGIDAFQITDETYKNMYFSSKITPLLETDNPTSDTRLAWIGPCATSRVVAIQLGHGRSAFGHPSYRKLVRNAVVWAAGRSE
jgi:type 1 glutamine amidotransferase